MPFAKSYAKKFSLFRGVAKESFAKIIFHKINKGKGAAIISSLKYIKGNLVVIQDADLEYDPGEIDLLFKPVIYDQADVVYGSRFIGGKPHRILFFWHSIGNKMLTFLSNVTTNFNLIKTDPVMAFIKVEKNT